MIWNWLVKKSLSETIRSQSKTGRFLIITTSGPLCSGSVVLLHLRHLTLRLTARSLPTISASPEHILHFSSFILTIYQYAYKILLFMIERYDSEAIIKKLFNYWLHIFPN